LHDRIDVKAVNPITDREYFARGQTALLDAVGRTINKIGSVQKNTAEEYRAEKVLFVITTDGMENASHEFNYDKIKSMIEHQKSEYKWEFIFLGANIDAVKTAGRFGIGSNRAQNFHNDSKGIDLCFASVCATASAFRADSDEGCAFDDWSAPIEADYKKRGKR
jgi:uncharacterized protein YegL